jgi:hypothetical protein
METKYSPQLDAQICEATATGMQGLKSVCDKLGISAYTVMCWLTEGHEDYIEIFSSHYARAKEMQADMMADRIVQAARRERIGQKVKRIKKGGKKLVKEGDITDESEDVEVTEADMVDRSRLEVDALKWIAARLRPKKWGDKLDVTTNGNDMAGVIILPPKNTDGQA